MIPPFTCLIILLPRIIEECFTGVRWSGDMLARLLEEKKLAGMVVLLAVVVDVDAEELLAELVVGCAAAAVGVAGACVAVVV